LFLTSCSTGITEHMKEEGLPVGSPDAPLTGILYLDYQCPQCKKFFESSWPAIYEDYISTGSLRVTIKDFPAHTGGPGIHNSAWCLFEQAPDKLPTYMSILYANQSSLRDYQLRSYGVSLGVDESSFVSCLEEGRYLTPIERIKQRGLQEGIGNTPTLIIKDRRFNSVSTITDITSYLSQLESTLD